MRGRSCRIACPSNRIATIGLSARNTMDRTVSRLASANPGLCIVLDPRGRCLHASRTWGTILGCDPEQLEGSGWLDALDPRDRADVERRLHDAMQRKSPFRADMRFRSPDGPVWLSVRTNPAFDGDELVANPGCAYEMPERVLRATDIATSCLAHGLQDMISVLTVRLHIELDRGGVAPEFAAAASSALQRVSDISRDLQGLDAPPIETDLNALLTGVAGSVCGFSSQPLDVRLELDPNLPPITAHRAHLLRAVVHLVIHVAEVGTGGVRLRTSLRSAAEGGAATKPSVSIEVGELTAPDAHTSPYMRIGGLALDLVEACASRHGGSLSIGRVSDEAEASAGADLAFTLELPIETVSKELARHSA